MGQSERARAAGAWYALVALAVLAGLGTIVPLVPLGAAGAATGASTVAARPSAGCAQPQAVRPGTTNQLLAAGGDQGGFVREVPPSYTGRVPLPVVIDLHGWSEPAAFQVQISQLGAYGDAHRFITVTPQVAEPALVWKLGFSGKDVAFVGRAPAHHRHHVVRRPQPHLRDRLFLRRVSHLHARVRRRRPDRRGRPGRRDTEPGRVPSVARPCRSSPSTARPTRSCPTTAVSDRPR